jgi:hypothetical protein
VPVEPGETALDLMVGELLGFTGLFEEKFGQFIHVAGIDILETDECLLAFFPRLGGPFSVGTICGFHGVLDILLAGHRNIPELFLGSGVDAIVFVLGIAGLAIDNVVEGGEVDGGKL